jgi:hypothetical protein
MIRCWMDGTKFAKICASITCPASSTTRTLGSRPYNDAVITQYKEQGNPNSCLQQR